MIFAMGFWLAKILLDIAMAVLIIVLLASICLVAGLPGSLRRSRCPHIKYRETRSCDAVCTSCGKNLGFIQPIREDKSKREIW